MIKKKIVTLTLGTILVIGSMGVAFAADTEAPNTTFARGNGVRLCDSGLTAEEMKNEIDNSKSTQMGR